MVKLKEMLPVELPGLPLEIRLARKQAHHLSFMAWLRARAKAPGYKPVKPGFNRSTNWKKRLAEGGK